MVRGDFVDKGAYCKVELSSWDLEARAQLVTKLVGPDYSCKIPAYDLVADEYEEFRYFRDNHPIECLVNNQCSQVRVCTATNPVQQQVPCPRGPEEAFRMPPLPDRKVWAVVGIDAGFSTPWMNYDNMVFTEYCDFDFLLPVGKMLAAQGLIAALALLVVIWFVTDVALHVAARRARRGIPKIDMDKVEEKFNRNLVELLWGSSGMSGRGMVQRNSSIMTPSARSVTPSAREGMISRIITASPVARGQSGMTPRASATPRSFKVAVCRDPSLAFSSVSWRKKVNAFVAQRVRSGGSMKQKILRAFFTPLGVVVFGSLLAWGYLAASPKDLVNMHSISDSILENYSTIFSAYATWIILPMLFLDELVDLFVYFCSMPMVRVGKQTMFSLHKNEMLEADLHSMETDEDEVDLSSISSGKVVEEDLIPACISAVICVDTRHLVDAEKFVENVKSVIQVVGIEKVFVLQFGQHMSPQDDTVTLLQKRVHPGIQYVYVPERDKLAAVYWFSKYYLPLFELHQSTPTKIPVSHLMVVDQNVFVPSCISIPHALMTSTDATDKTGVICFAPSVKTTAPFRDVDLKFDIVQAIFQSNINTMGDSEVGGALLTVWDRQALECAAFDHKPLTEANGGDFAGAALELLKPLPSETCVNRKIKFVSNTQIRINGDSGVSFPSLFAIARRRRLVFTDIASLLSPMSLLNLNRLAAKPANLVHVLQAVFDAVRLPVLLASGLRDPIGVVAIVGLVLVLQWIRVITLSIVVLPPAVKKERPSFFTVLMYPIVYVVYDLALLRPAAVVAAVFWSVNDRPAQCIHEREDYEKDMPPCLPYPDAPWFSAWLPEPDTDV